MRLHFLASLWILIDIIYEFEVVRLVNDSFIVEFQNAAADMEKAVSELEESGVDSYILDLRNNPVRVRFSVYLLREVHQILRQKNT